MSLPQARLTTRLNAISALTAIVGQNIVPAILPGTKHYPAIVYQVLSNQPVNDADGSSNSFLMKLRISAIGLTIGAPSPPYDLVWAAAMAIAGDAEAEAPTGLSGWIDSEGSVWHVEDMFDEAGEIQLGTDTLYAYVVNIPVSVQWVYQPGTDET